MENELFYLQQALELRQEANEAIKAIRFVLGMKTFDPLLMKDYMKLLNFINDLEIISDCLKSACKNAYEELKKEIKK